MQAVDRHDFLLAELSKLSWSGDRYIPALFNKAEISESRRFIRTQVFIDRGGRRNAISSLGARGASEYHEIINRARTPEGTIARWLTYQPELCALLTRDEHSIAHNPEMRNTLFHINYELYGYEDVKRVYDLVNEFLNVPLLTNLPEL